HASFKINTKDLVIYTDPFKIPDNMIPADLILISHGHYDHCDPADIAKISKPTTIILTTEEAKRKVKGNVQVMGQHGKFKIKGTTITSIPAYNRNKPYHPKGSGIGFIIDTTKTRIYFAGDTDYTEDMDKVEKIDICLVPIGGTYTMNEQEAAQFVNNIKPKVAIPMHYGTITAGDPVKFKQLTEGSIDVRILA
ncbi:MAG: MBL fold metallo-hydrolase, partial [archaeon]